MTKRLRDEGCAPKNPDVAVLSSEEEEHVVPVKKLKKGEVTSCRLNVPPIVELGGREGFHVSVFYLR